MKKARFALCIVLICTSFLTCRCAQTSPSPSPAKTQSTSDRAILTITGSGASQTLTLAQLKALPATTGWAGIKTSVGTIVPPALYKGVSLLELSNLVGGLGSDAIVEIVAADGYAMTMSHNEAANARFVTYDPKTGKEIRYNEPIQVVIAYEREGKPLPEDTDGTLRLVVTSAEAGQITDGHWSVKWVRSLVIKSVQAWTLHLEGRLTEEMERRTFEEGAAACCHRRPWEDAYGNMWAGVPLWRLVGLVDDEVRHQVMAFNAPLAEQGYEIQIQSADGRSVSLDSRRVMYSMDIIVAHLMNDQELEQEYFPLRLVGAELEESEMLGQVTRIVLRLPAVSPAAEPLPTAAPSKPLTVPAGGLFTISGKVQRDLVVRAEDIRQMQVTVEGHHFSGSLETYAGARLNELVQRAGPTADARFVVLTSIDGGEARMPLALLATCPDCVVGLDENGQAQALMPEMDCYFWMKQLVLLDIR